MNVLRSSLLGERNDLKLFVVFQTILELLLPYGKQRFDQLNFLWIY